MLAHPLFRWLKPHDISRVSQLQWLARGVVEGLSGGMHRSRHIGSSVDFKEHRPYVHGDEIRSIDWKVYGKTDRLFIRQFEDETNLRATLLVDQSNSMRYAGPRSNRVSKHEYAVQLAACLAYLFTMQQDAVGVVTFDTRVRINVPARASASHLRVLMESLASSQCHGETDLGATFQEVLGICRRRGLVILLSDCFGDIESIVRNFGVLRSNHQELVVFQILDDDEVDFPFQNRTMFRSMEQPDQQILFDPASMRKAYLRNFEHFEETLRNGCQRHRIDLIPVRTSESFSQVVASYVARRGAA